MAYPSKDKDPDPQEFCFQCLNRDMLAQDVNLIGQCKKLATALGE